MHKIMSFFVIPQIIQRLFCRYGMFCEEKDAVCGHAATHSCLDSMTALDIYAVLLGSAVHLAAREVAGGVAVLLETEQRQSSTTSHARWKKVRRQRASWCRRAKRFLPNELRGFSDCNYLTTSSPHRSALQRELRSWGVSGTGRRWYCHCHSWRHTLLPGDTALP